MKIAFRRKKKKKKAVKKTIEIIPRHFAVKCRLFIVYQKFDKMLNLAPFSRAFFLLCWEKRDFERRQKNKNKKKEEERKRTKKNGRKDFGLPI